MLFQTAALLALTGVAAAAPEYGKPCGCSAPTTASSAASTTASSAGWEASYTATGTQEVAQAAATAKTSSPTSHVKGKAFDRFVIIYFENQNYDKSAGDPNFQFFAKKGVTLTNYHAVTHPSEPNYLASIAGDYFGMDNDDFSGVDLNVSTVADLLDYGKISWGQYQEDMPYSGFEGFAYVNQKNGANDYVRKHNPLVLANSVTHSEDRLSRIKNLSMIDTSRSAFHRDLAANNLPQWLFITPNMTSDGHDTSVTVAGTWCRTFLEPLLNDKHFMQNTLVLITWDENETYTDPNKILGILLGDALPGHLVGTVDNNYYNHYSQIATVSANWNLPTLGRWDVGANIFEWVAKLTGDRLSSWPSQGLFQSYFWNSSYAGVFNTEGGGIKSYPAPNLALDKSRCGRHVLDSIKKTWAGSNAPTYYTDSIENNDGMHPPAGFEATK